jgi:hypothetical protein
MNCFSGPKVSEVSLHITSVLGHDKKKDHKQKLTAIEVTLPRKAAS